MRDHESIRRLIEWENYQRQVISVVPEFLPPNVKRLLVEFVRDPHIPAIVITGLPVDESLPPTPDDGRRPAEKSAISESILTGVSWFAGEVLSYREELEGMPTHQLAPQKDKDREQSNGGRDRFKRHNDNRFIPEPFRQRYIGLFGLRNTENVATTFLPVTDILKQLEPRRIRDLRQPLYGLKGPASFNLGGHYITDYRPILYTDSLGRECISLPSADVEPKNSLAKTTFAEFRYLIEEVITPREIIIRPGTLCLFRDDLGIHGRDAVSGDRWLQRIYVAPTLAALRQATGSDPREFCFSVRRLLGL